MKTLLTKIQENQFLTFFVEHYKASEMDLSSIAVAYYLLLTLFPFTVLLANIFPYLQIDISELLVFLEMNLPTQLSDTLSGLVRGVFNKTSSGLLWVSILTGLWTTSQGLIFLQKAVNKAYDIQDHRDAILVRLVGGAISILLVICVALAIFVSTFGEMVLGVISRYWNMDDSFYSLLSQLAQYLPLTILVLALGVLYYILPNVRVRRWTNVWPGTLFVSIVLLTSTKLFSLYLDSALRRLEDIRFIGSMTVLVLMFWFIFFAKVLIMGAILNSSYQRFYEGKLEQRRGDIISLVRENLLKK